jgi:outer membrane protein
VTNQQVALNRSRNSLRPNLDLVAGYQQFGLGGTRIVRDFSQGFFDPPIVGIEPGGVRNSLDQLVSGEFYGYVLRLDLQVPIFNREARAENAQAQIAINRSRLRRDALGQSISLEIRDALTQAETNQARVEAASAAVRSAEERLQGETARFEVGVGTTRELIEAQRDLLLAETILLRSQVDLIKSHALLDRAVGRTFDRFNLRLAEALQVNVR